MAKEFEIGHPDDDKPSEEPYSVSTVKKPLSPAEKFYQKGFRLMTGYGGQPKDYVQAAECFLQAISLGNKKACFALGLCYLRGRGVPKDEAKAVQLFKQYPRCESYERLADCYLNGKGVERSVATAREYLLLALQEGSSTAQAMLDSLPKE